MLHHALNVTLFPYTTLFRSQRAGNRRAVNLDERPVSPPGAPMDESRKDFLAGPALSLEQDRYIRVRCFLDRKSTRLNSSHVAISYAVFCLKKKIQRIIC